MEVLDKALELPEYPGRVRGAGYGVTKDHFLPKNKRRRVARVDLDELEARIREEVEARVREETKAELAGLYGKIEELQRQQHGNTANAPSSCLNESPTQALQGIPGVESPQTDDIIATVIQVGRRLCSYPHTKLVYTHLGRRNRLYPISSSSTKKNIYFSHLLILGEHYKPF